MSIVILDYGLGNVGSVANMFKLLGKDVMISKEQSVVSKAKMIILPGVGSFDKGMEKIRENGLVHVLNKKVIIEGTPILGICLGLQLMTKESDEGISQGLGWFDNSCKKFEIDRLSNYKIPHMGWNEIKPIDNSIFNKLFLKIEDEIMFYFVHSYHISEFSSEVIASSNYIYDFPVVLIKNNIIGVQFHPEKSHIFGLMFLKNLLQYFNL